MRVPQVSERIKEAPAQALRGVFAGIGQLLLITDKLRNKTPASQQVPQARAPEPAETVSPAAPVPADQPAPAPAAAAAPAPAAAAAPAPAAAAAPAPAAAPAAAAAPAPAPAAAAPAAAPAPAADRDFDKTGNVRLLTSAEATASEPTVEATAAEAAPVAEAARVAEPGAPLPNYDGLSIASLRARLRNLDVAQLRQLVAYESAHAGRADVITMFERRIAKLQAETTPEERGEAAAEAGAEARDAVEAEVQDEVGPEAEDEA
jgi:hypothetical protein